MQSFWKPGEKASSDHAPGSANPRSSTPNDGSVQKPTLSKNVMAMKFMKRKADNDSALLEDDEKRKKLLDSHWPSSGSSSANNPAECGLLDGSRFSKESGDLMAALPGRRSFGGFNKAVERYYEQIMDEKRFNRAAEKANKNSVSDEEMLARYESLIGLPRGPNQGAKQQRQQGKSTGSREQQSNSSAMNSGGNRGSGSNKRPKR
jgi:M-phase phosphoprotein 6